MKTKELTIIALLIGLSLILSYVKFFGSIALDSVPAFVALLLWKDYKAGLIGGIGHIFTALTSGFIFGLFTHILIAILMFVMLFLAAKIIRKHSTIFTFIFILFVNALVMPFTIFIMTPFSMEMYMSLVLMLSLAVIVNLSIAYVLYISLNKVISND